MTIVGGSCLVNRTSRNVYRSKMNELTLAACRIIAVAGDGGASLLRLCARMGDRNSSIADSTTCTIASCLVTSVDDADDIIHTMARLPSSERLRRLVDNRFLRNHLRLHQKTSFPTYYQANKQVC